MDIALVEMVLVFGIVLGVALWQIISVRREIREDERRKQLSASTVAKSQVADVPSDQSAGVTRTDAPDIASDDSPRSK